MIEKYIQFFVRPDVYLTRKFIRSNLDTVSVYGIGDLGKSVVRLLEEKQIKVNQWYDSSVSIEAGNLLGYPLCHKSLLANDNADAIILATELYADQMQVICHENGFKGHIIRL